MSHLGELAALATAVCWTITAVAFEAAGRRVGSLAVNFIRLVLALVPLSFLCLVTRGYFLPVDASPQAWFWLALSGLIGFTFGDLCLLRAFVLVGARISMLIMMSLTPPMAAVIGWLFLREQLTGQDWLGMVVTIAGVAWVVLERRPERAVKKREAEGEAAREGEGRGQGKVRGANGGAGEDRHRGQADERVPHPKTKLGILLAVAAAVGQSVGLVLSKLGMGAYSPFAATQIRIIAGTIGFALLFFAIRWWPRVFRALGHRGAMARTSLGAIFGPFLGVSFSLLAIQHAATGVAATIMSIVPVLIIVPAIFFFHEKVSFRAFLGAVVAASGVALLFL